MTELPGNFKIEPVAGHERKPHGFPIFSPTFIIIFIENFFFAQKLTDRTINNGNNRKTSGCAVAPLLGNVIYLRAEGRY